MKYFTIDELCHSDTAIRLKIDNTPDETVIENLTYLIDNLLDPIRELYGNPIKTSSGYRCLILNRAVGGVKTSQHQKGCAADLKVWNVNVLFKLIKESGLMFDQMIKYPTFIHVSLKKSGNRMQIIIK